MRTRIHSRQVLRASVSASLIGLATLAGCGQLLNFSELHGIPADAGENVHGGSYDVSVGTGASPEASLDSDDDSPSAIDAATGARDGARQGDAPSPGDAKGDEDDGLEPCGDACVDSPGAPDGPNRLLDAEQDGESGAGCDNNSLSWVDWTGHDVGVLPSNALPVNPGGADGGVYVCRETEDGLQEHLFGTFVLGQGCLYTPTPEVLDASYPPTLVAGSYSILTEATLCAHWQWDDGKHGLFGAFGSSYYPPNIYSYGGDYSGYLYVCSAPLQTTALVGYIRIFPDESSGCRVPYAGSFTDLVPYYVLAQ